jgi:hypothetical protein
MRKGGKRLNDRMEWEVSSAFGRNKRSEGMITCENHVLGLEDVERLGVRGELHPQALEVGQVSSHVGCMRSICPVASASRFGKLASS